VYVVPGALVGAGVSVSLFGPVGGVGAFVTTAFVAAFVGAFVGAVVGAAVVGAFVVGAFVVGAFVAGWVGDTVILGLHSSEQVVLQ